MSRTPKAAPSSFRRINPSTCHNQHVELFGFDFLCANHRSRSVPPSVPGDGEGTLISLSAAVIGPFIFGDIRTTEVARFQSSDHPSHFTAKIYTQPCKGASLGCTADPFLVINLSPISQHARKLHLKSPQPDVNIPGTLRVLHTCWRTEDDRV